MSEQKAEVIFKEKGLRITPQRVLIYQALANNTKHPTVNDIYQLVREQNHNISFDTVFRTVNEFSKLGIIQAVSSAAGVKRYDPNIQTHHHFECLNCGQIIDYHELDLNLGKALQQIARKQIVVNAKLVAQGICSECQQIG